MSMTEWVAQHKTYIVITEGSMEASVYFDTEEERDAFLAKFPKSVGLRKNVCGVKDIGWVPCVQLRAKFRTDGVNGGVNETGIKRSRRFLSAIKEQIPGSREISWSPISIDGFLASTEAVAR